jgi:hypothetical protein
LRKFGLVQELEQTTRQMSELVLQGRDAWAIDWETEANQPGALATLLLVASQWYYLDHDSQADAIIEVAHEVLLENYLPRFNRIKLLIGYAAALGEAPVDVARNRLEEIFDQIKGIGDTYTTATHYDGAQLNVVEAVVIAALQCSGAPLR